MDTNKAVNEKKYKTIKRLKLEDWKCFIEKRSGYLDKHPRLEADLQNRIRAIENLNLEWTLLSGWLLILPAYLLMFIIIPIHLSRYTDIKPFLTLTIGLWVVIFLALLKPSINEYSRKRDDKASIEKVRHRYFFRFSERNADDFINASEFIFGQRIIKSSEQYFVEDPNGYFEEDSEETTKAYLIKDGDKIGDGEVDITGFVNNRDEENVTVRSEIEPTKKSSEQKSVLSGRKVNRIETAKTVEKELHKEKFFAKRSNYLTDNPELTIQINNVKQTFHQVISPQYMWLLAITYVLLISGAVLIVLLPNPEMKKLVSSILAISLICSVFIFQKMFFHKTKSFQKKNYLVFIQSCRNDYLEEITVGQRHKSMTITEFITGSTIKEIDGYNYIKLKSGNYRKLQNGDIIGSGERDFTDLIVNKNIQVKNNNE